MTREEAIQVLANFYVSTKNPKANHLCEAVYFAIQALKNEPKHGRWINDKGLYKCSVCNNFTITGWANCIPIEQMNKTMKYCNNCGARMDLDEVEE